MALAALLPATPAAAAGPCGPPVASVIACENSLPGTPESDWRVDNADSSIEGFATAMSVNAGETEAFKIKTTATSYHLDIYRLGYYQGNGARRVAAGIRPTSTPSQPTCISQTQTGLVDCGTWAVVASWAVPSTAVSGIYVADLVRDDTGGANQIVFVVRNDDSHSDLLVQTSDTTWQAYNTYGGNSLYSGAPVGRAYAVSYNRPFTTSSPNFVWDSEYPMVRFLEANGYDVSYLSGLDTDLRGSLLGNHKMFMSSGHDEYWSGGQRASVEAARAAGVNLAFFSGNEMFWKTRWAPSIDGSNTANRTIVCYKETHANQVIDPQDPPTWTGTWRDSRFSPPADGGRPENALTGQFFSVNSGTTDIQVPYAYSRLRLWRNTAVAGLSPGQTATLAAGTGVLGYEWDEEVDNGFRPAGLVDLSSTTANVPEAFTDYGSTVAAGTRTHHLSLYRAPSGALVFGSGTVQWSWGLDNSNPTGRSPDRSMQQATVNLLADMGVQPYTLIAGLTVASASIDSTAPTSTITSPTDGSTIADGTRMTVSGTASDVGGSVAGVEVSTDGGASWHPATGTTNWSYSFVVHGAPSFSVKSRAADDSGNLETPSAGVSVVTPCPCSIWGPNVTPAIADSGDTGSVEVGMKFKADVYGVVSGIRFYKAGTNTGTHVGNLWTASGTRLATATFSGESASGWQQVNFSNPVSVTPNTTYVASYFAPKGHYAQTSGYFYPPPSPPPDGGGTVDAGPLHALRNTPTSGNGVYTYAGASAFPASTFGAENYWVDVVFSPTPAPGQVTNVTASAGYASAALTWSAPTGGQVTTYTVTPYIGGTAQTPTVVTGDPAATGTTVTGLTNGTTYAFTVTASNPAGTGPPSALSNPVTPLASLLIVSNGGFESGLSPWAAAGITSPAVTTAKAHTGNSSAVLGTVSGSEPLGDSNLSQRVTLPTGTSTLSFWYWPATTDSACSGTTCVYDWQEAQLRNSSGTTLASIFKRNSNAQAWTQVTFDTSAYAGQTVVLWFNVHQDGANPPDDTSMYLDDVTLNGSTPPPPTVPAAPTAVTATAGNGTATVSWTAPADGGSAITGYQVTPYLGTAAQTPVAVTGAATSTTVSGLTNGTAYTFTVTATNAIGSGPPSAASNAVTPGVVGPITVDKSVFVDGSGTMTSPALTTATANELLLAFVSLDGPSGGQTATVSGAGLTWSLARRSNGQPGDSEIWSARASAVITSQTVVVTPASGGFHGSLTVIAFQKAAGVGASASGSAATGAPDVVVPGTGAGSWVYAVGNDWDGATARTPSAGQTIVHQRVDSAAGDTFWVQSTTAANAVAGSVDIHDTAPTNHRWNYAAVEVTPGS
jgi:hypothetical protein